ARADARTRGRLPGTRIQHLHRGRARDARAGDHRRPRRRGRGDRAVDPVADPAVQLAGGRMNPGGIPMPLLLERARRVRGFTLVELMVVIVILGLLATVVMINVMPSQDRAMAEKARADVSVLEQALETYRLD